MSNVIPIGLSVEKQIQDGLDNFLIDRFVEIAYQVAGRVNMDAGPELMDRQETKHFLKDISDPKLNRYVKMGMPKHKDGNTVYYLRSEVMDFISKLPGE